MRNLMTKGMSIMASFAFAIALFANGTTCVFLIHQPKVPEALLKMAK